MLWGIEAAKGINRKLVALHRIIDNLYHAFISPVIDKSHNKSLKYALANIFFNDNSTTN